MENFNFEGNQEDVLNLLNSAYNNTRGLIISGPVGTGKTRLMLEWINTLPDQVYRTGRGMAQNPRKPLLLVKGDTKVPFTPTYFQEQYVANGATWMSKLADTMLGGALRGEKALYIDDLGAESTTISAHFGENKNVMYEVLKTYLDKIDDSTKPVMLFITTNLTKAELVNRYGEQVVSRLSQCCDFVELSAEHLRTKYKRSVEIVQETAPVKPHWSEFDITEEDINPCQIGTTLP